MYVDKPTSGQKVTTLIDQQFVIVLKNKLVYCSRWSGPNPEVKTIKDADGLIAASMQKHSTSPNDVHVYEFNVLVSINPGEPQV